METSKPILCQTKTFLKKEFSITDLSTAAILFGSNPMIVELLRRLTFFFFAF